jgi:hypothetical protein
MFGRAQWLSPAIGGVSRQRAVGQSDGAVHIAGFAARA